MKNKLVDLNNHLFAQMERLSDEDLTAEELERELQRTKGINAIAKCIIDNANTALEGAKLASDLPRTQQTPEMFKLKDSNA